MRKKVNIRSIKRLQNRTLQKGEVICPIRFGAQWGNRNYREIKIDPYTNIETCSDTDHENCFEEKKIITLAGVDMQKLNEPSQI
jgi:hypothetical protein